jgi:alkylhydroperoxidase family enzyme
MRNFALSILALGAFAVAAPAQPEKPAPKVPFPALPDGDAWDKLPPAKKPVLPEWARALAGPLPKTTAKLLELDNLHRTKNPLGPVLSGKIRWIAAEAIGCEYGRAAAEADLRRAGLTAPDFVPLADPSRLTADERTTFIFVASLCQRAHAITDQEFAAVLKIHGPEKLTAIVHTVAYANFHNRLVLALGAKGERPIAEPVGAAFALDGAKVKAPERPPWDDLKNAKGDGLAVRVAWGDKELDTLNKTLEKQKERKLRMPLPDKSAFEKLSPQEKDSAKKILWNTVSMGYQPELTRAWFAPLYAFYDEAKVDRVFTNSMFWVVTRTNDCFY